MKKISIITVTYNSEATLKETIESVLGQDYSNVEYIIVDGASKDRTVDIVRSYGQRIAKFISEPDRGLYDAMNKGIDMATGDIVGILNSDDLYVDNTILSTVVSAFDRNNISALYGDIYYFRTENPDKAIRYYRGGNFSLKRVSYGLMPPHPSFFVTRRAYEKYGKFDLRYTLSGDFDLILRLLGVHKISFLYLPQLLVKMRMGGQSTSSFKRTILMNKEDLLSCRINGVKTNFMKFHSKYVYKVFKLLMNE